MRIFDDFKNIEILQQNNYIRTYMLFLTADVANNAIRLADEFILHRDYFSNDILLPFFVISVLLRVPYLIFSGFFSLYILGRGVPFIKKTISGGLPKFLLLLPLSMVFPWLLFFFQMTLAYTNLFEGIYPGEIAPFTWLSSVIFESLGLIIVYLKLKKLNEKKVLINY